MDSIVAHDPRVWAILKTPDEYFATARSQAWLRATEEVAADLARRAQRRRNESKIELRRTLVRRTSL